MSGKTNILLRGHGRLHADIKKYLADNIEVKVWMDKGKYAKRTGADLTHDLNAFYRRLQIHKKTGALSVDYQYRREFLSISEKLAPHIPTFLYIYSRKPVLNGENNFMDMMDAFHIYVHFFIDLLKSNSIDYIFFSTIPHHADYILYLVAKALNIKPVLNGENNFMDMMDAFHIYVHFFIDLLKSNSIDYIFFSTIPHHADYILYLVAKELNIKTVAFLQSQEPGKAFMVSETGDLGALSENAESIRPTPLQRNERKSHWYMQHIPRQRLYTKIISALLFRMDSDLFFHRLSTLRKARQFKRDYKRLTATQLPTNPFVYFPLHLQPELTTMSLGGQFVDQMLAIEHLRALLPDDWAIVVKENPKQTAYARGALFFARLAKIPNLSYVGKTFDTYDLIEKSQFCATVTGTAGFEALTFGKHVLVFGQAIYKNFPGVVQYRNGLTHEDIMSATFSHAEVELAYAKLARTMVDLVVDADTIHQVNEFSAEENTRALANIINQAVRI